MESVEFTEYFYKSRHLQHLQPCRTWICSEKRSSGSTHNTAHTGAFDPAGCFQYSQLWSRREISNPENRFPLIRPCSYYGCLATKNNQMILKIQEPGNRPAQMAVDDYWTELMYCSTGMRLLILWPGSFHRHIRVPRQSYSPGDGGDPYRQPGAYALYNIRLYPLDIVGLRAKMISSVFLRLPLFTRGINIELFGTDAIKGEIIPPSTW